MQSPEGLSQDEQDHYWMQLAFQLAAQSESEGEVPVGAVLVHENRLIAQGWNQPIQKHDPTAHAEIMVLKKAGNILENYRLVDTTLYVTLEPCPMCAGAMVHARVKRLVYGAADLKTGAAGSVFNFIEDSRLNHQISVTSGVMQAQCSHQLSSFFKKRRIAHKENKQREPKIHSIEACGDL